MAGPVQQGFSPLQQVCRLAQPRADIPLGRPAAQIGGPWITGNLLGRLPERCEQTAPEALPEALQFGSRHLLEVDGQDVQLKLIRFAAQFLPDLQNQLAGAPLQMFGLFRRATGNDQQQLGLLQEVGARQCRQEVTQMLGVGGAIEPRGLADVDQC